MPSHHDTPLLRLARLMLRSAWKAAGHKYKPTGLVLIQIERPWVPAMAMAARMLWPASYATTCKQETDHDVLLGDLARRSDDPSAGDTVVVSIRACTPRLALLAADHVLDVPLPLWKEMRLMARLMDGRSPPPHAGDDAALMPHTISLLWRGGSGAESLAKLKFFMDSEATAKAEDSDRAAARHSRRDPVPAGVAKPPPTPVERPTERLAGLPGLGAAEAWGRRLATDLADYKAGRLAWADLDCGLLLSGPPGCGKTNFARALAGECGVPLVVGSLAVWQASGSGHLGDMLRGMGAAFAAARERVPCVLFIDEMDSIGDRIASTGPNAGYQIQVVNALLEHLSGLTSREGVVVVAATNHPHLIDSALRRAGRLDRHIRLRLPDAAARAAILALHLGDVLGLRQAAMTLDGLSGADLALLSREARRLARGAGRPVAARDVRMAAAALRDETCAESVCLASWKADRSAMH